MVCMGGDVTVLLDLGLLSGGGRGGSGGGGGHMPPGAGRGGAPSGCNLHKNSKLSNKILTRNERTGYPQSLPHSKFVAKNAIDSRKCVSFWGSAPDPAGGAYSAPPD